MIKERFDIRNFPGDEYVMVCKTREQSEIFREYLDSIGKKWLSGDRYTELNYDDSSIDKGYAIGYFFNRDTKSAITKYYEHDKYSLFFGDFEWAGYNAIDVSFSFEDMLCAEE